MTDLKPVTLDDLFITRDDEGALVPVEVISDLFNGTVKLVPATYGYIKRKGLNMQVSAVKWDTSDKLEFAQTHIMVPNISSLTVEDIEDRMGPMTLDHLVSLVVAHSIPMNRLRQRIEPLAEAIKQILSKNDSQDPSTSSTPLDTPT